MPPTSKDSPEDPSDGQVAAAGDLASRLFVMQHQRPADLRQMEIAALDPFLRSLLFTDGTVTRALEVQTLSHVSVEVIDQSRSRTPAEAASCLEIAAATESVRRRVMMRVRPPGSPSSPEAPAVYAESHIVPDRLPPRFLELLSGNPDGIGEALQQVQLESWRELLWFGLGAAPSWAPIVATPQVLVRLYRIITHGQPALLISESFMVELSSGAYRLVGLGDSTGDRSSPLPAARAI